MITVQMLNIADPHTILQSGLCDFNGEIKKYVAVTGGIGDWACYVGDVGDDEQEIARGGYKTFPSLRNFPLRGLSKDVLARYRS
jgi:hypothetical protein